MGQDRRQPVASGSPWEPTYGFSRVFRVGAVVHVASAATMVVVAGLIDERWLVEIEAEAVVTGAADGE